MKKRREIIENADDRPRIWLRQVIRQGRTFGEWRLHAAAVGRIELTVPLALEAALAAVDHQPAVIIWEGREQVAI